jgi:hypothetical protein
MASGSHTPTARPEGVAPHWPALPCGQNGSRKRRADQPTGAQGWEAHLAQPSSPHDIHMKSIVTASVGEGVSPMPTKL